MDSLITAAAHALAAGDPLVALKHVALRDDPAALALRGIAMAQLGDLARAKLLLRSAARAFGPREAVARARCIIAEAEIALVSRDLTASAKPLADARDLLEARGDARNAAHARCVDVRRLLLIGQLDEAERALAGIDANRLPPALCAARELAAAGIALRRLQADAAHAALVRAATAAQQARIPALVAEVAAAAQVLQVPAARLVARDTERTLRLADVQALLASDTFVVDACRHLIRHAGTTVTLATRPVLFALAHRLAAAWPHDTQREDLIREAFRTRYSDDSHRARLRVEIGRLRAALKPIAGVRATPRGFTLVPHRARDVVVLERPVDEKHAAVLALLADGESWSSSALALALGASQRTVQRSLDALAATGKAHAFGRGRAQRWTMPPLPGFATALLLPGPLPGD
ncbi:MAG TPA: helix-turn-helix domain-containing protein [Tahibacter sp.]|uniref:helix-turn-helix domain-containing protein n=1 Tax=Tahibacter sp. TaxID=2056211 RepID=UPI002CC11414|nr:helix-turn-helix domain-containing protein [Tahibacter sp.]HSX62106.1 helix-turn-helix domain-containing protein [Tahibacter sp.]